MITHKMTHQERAERREKIRAELLAGAKSVEELSTEYRVSMATVQALVAPGSRRARRMGGPGVAVSTYKVIARLLNTNDSYRMISSELGCSHQNIHQIAGRMKAAGINFPVRPHGGSLKGRQRNKDGTVAGKLKEEKPCPNCAKRHANGCIDE